MQLRFEWAVMAFAASLATGVALAAGNGGLDAPATSKIQRLKAKANSEKAGEESPAAAARKKHSGDAGCGSVSIGNVITDKRAGSPKEITTIVTGDVINANNTCK